MNDQNTCMACSCPCEMHKEHSHPVAQAEKGQEHSITCSKCGFKAKAPEQMEEHTKESVNDHKHVTDGQQV